MFLPLNPYFGKKTFDLKLKKWYVPWVRTNESLAFSFLASKTEGGAVPMHTTLMPLVI